MRRITSALKVVAVAAVAAAAGYMLLNDADVNRKAKELFQQIKKASVKSVNEMTEEAAVKAAQATKNPKINQAWVENQWKSAGFSS